MSSLTKTEANIVLDALCRYHYRCMVDQVYRVNPKTDVEDIEATIETIKQKLNLVTFSVGDVFKNKLSDQRYMIVCPEPNKAALINLSNGCYFHPARYVDDVYNITLKQLQNFCADIDHFVVD